MQSKKSISSKFNPALDGALRMVEGGSVSVVVVSEMMFIVDAIFWLGICTLEFEVETLEEVV